MDAADEIQLGVEAESSNDPYVIAVGEAQYGWFYTGVAVATECHQQGDPDSAWYVLLKLAEKKGYLRGLIEGKHSRSCNDTLRRQVASSGRKGGKQKGVAYTACQNEAISALKKCRPAVGWRTIPDLYKSIDEVSAPIYQKFGLPFSERQRGILQNHKYVKAEIRTIQSVEG